MKLKTEYVLFPNRRARSLYVRERFSDYLKESVLDVGCFEAHLRDLLPEDVSYTGVDVEGSPDLVLNLEKVEILPFEEDGQRPLNRLDT